MKLKISVSATIPHRLESIETTRLTFRQDPPYKGNWIVNLENIQLQSPDVYEDIMRLLVIGKQYWIKHEIESL